ncbi:MAG TPA: site-specific integrase [Candidatus Udaeobacter sp.]|jgi:integrase
MKLRKSTKTWQKTRKPNLLRHKSGRYYGRAFAGGKEVWKSLKTSHCSVAEAKLAEFLKEHRERVNNGNGEVSAKMTFGEALKIHQQNLADNVTIKPATRHYWQQIFVALLKSWSGLADREIRRVTKTDCKEWARGFRKAASSTRYNNTVSGLRHVFEVGKDAGIIYSNPAENLGRVPVRAKQVTLPSSEQFLQVVDAVEHAGAWCSRDCADFLRGLAFTGCRKGEAAQITWRDVDFDAGEIVVRGDPETATKNWTVRRVPLIPEARELFDRMRAERADEPLDARVFGVREAQKALDGACNKVEAERITHHDLRHLFATRCIESGVDIPTVSRWLGHKDGGTLAMRTYGHLRREHSIAQAQRVTFTPVAVKGADIIHFSAPS